MRLRLASLRYSLLLLSILAFLSLSITSSGAATPQDELDLQRNRDIYNALSPLKETPYYTGQDKAQIQAHTLEELEKEAQVAAKASCAFEKTETQVSPESHSEQVEMMGKILVLAVVIILVVFLVCKDSCSAWFKKGNKGSVQVPGTDQENPFPEYRTKANMPEGNHPSELLQESPGYPSLPGLVECPSCKKYISRRADKCPGCGSVTMLSCGVCKQDIPRESSSCPKCGDPSPFDDKGFVESRMSIPELELEKELGYRDKDGKPIITKIAVSNANSVRPAPATGSMRPLLAWCTGAGIWFVGLLLQGSAYNSMHKRPGALGGMMLTGMLVGTFFLARAIFRGIKKG